MDVRCILGAIICFISVADGDPQDETFQRLLEKIEPDPCIEVTNGMTSMTLAEWMRRRAAADVVCKEIFELLSKLPDYERGNCLGGSTPRCTYTTESMLRKSKVIRCSVQIPSVMMCFAPKRISIYSCVKDSLKAYKNKKHKEALERSMSTNWSRGGIPMEGPSGRSGRDPEGPLRSSTSTRGHSAAPSNPPRRSESRGSFRTSPVPPLTPAKDPKGKSVASSSQPQHQRSGSWGSAPSSGRPSADSVSSGDGWVPVPPPTPPPLSPGRSSTDSGSSSDEKWTAVPPPPPPFILDDDPIPPPPPTSRKVTRKSDPSRRYG